MSTRALSKIRKAIFNNPKGAARGIIEYYWVYILDKASCRHALIFLYPAWLLLISQPLQDKLQWLKPQTPPKILCSHYPSLVNKVAMAFISRLVVIASGLNAVAKVVKVAVLIFKSQQCYSNWIMFQALGSSVTMGSFHLYGIWLSRIQI